jgi:type IV pilus assembly protein PilX
MNCRCLVNRAPGAPPRAQSGATLVISLILLVVVTLLGIASMRGTQMQERMSSNMYDRSLAFQRSESALRAAESAITGNWKVTDLGGVDCSPATGNLCAALPATTFIDDNTNWTPVDSTHDVNDGMTPGVPQYQIQLVATGTSEGNVGAQQNADYANYGNSYPPDNVAYYRVTARSSNPAVAGDRSIVVLQSTVKRAY